MSRICILTFEGNPIAAELFHRLSGNHEILVVFTPDRSCSFSQIWSRKRGLRWLLYNLAFRLAARKYRVGHIPRPSWKELQSSCAGQFRMVSHHNSAAEAELLKSWKPDLGVLIGPPLIKKRVFSIPARGMINLHQGHIPSYRGAPPAYWEHRNGEGKMHVTVHTVTRHFDAGAVLEEAVFSIVDHPHFVVSKYYANSLSARMIEIAAEKALAGQAGDERCVDSEVNTVPGLLSVAREFVKLFCAGFKPYRQGEGECALRVGSDESSAAGPLASGQRARSNEEDRK